MSDLKKSFVGGSLKLKAEPKTKVISKVPSEAQSKKLKKKEKKKHKKKHKKHRHHRSSSSSSSSGSKEKRKRHSDDKPIKVIKAQKQSHHHPAQDEEEKHPVQGGGYPGMTDAERKYQEALKARQKEKIVQMAGITHKEKVDRLNRYLASLPEHYDIPKVGPG